MQTRACRSLLGAFLCLPLAMSVTSAWDPMGQEAAPVAGQENQASPSQQQAAEGEKAIAAQDWATAAACFERVVESAPSEPRGWMRLGLCRYQLRDFGAAIEAYAKVTSGPGVPTARYNTACALALQGKTNEAFEALTRAVDAGFRDKKTFDADSDLAGLRADPRFAALAARLASAPPKKSQPPAEARQFDFWVGEWDVFNSDGSRAGSSRVESILGGCIVLENWTNAQGNEGKSFNRYDPLKREWRQHWVDDAGNELLFVGAFSDGCMAFLANTPQPDMPQPGGAVHQSRMRFFDLPGDEVRQWGELSKDGGATWTTEYDLTYRPKAKR